MKQPASASDLLGASLSQRGATLARIDRFLSRQAPPTPCVVIDLETVRQHCLALRALLPQAHIYYAVKANPAPPVLATLAKMDIGFDVASSGEIGRCLGIGAVAQRCCFGNTIKRESDIAEAHAAGIPLFAFDSAAELEKLARAAPGARVFCRLAVPATGAEWPLSRKFGCSAAMAVELLTHAGSLGLRATGVSFHVGSQQTDPLRWDAAIGAACNVFNACRRAGVMLDILDVGGGLPAQYRTRVPPLAEYAEAIVTSMQRHFGPSAPQLMIEPGRYMTADAGLLRAQVLLIARHGGHDGRRWIYLDAGRYNGLAETQGEAIHYALRTGHDGGPAEAAVLAGPTCDSTDVIYDRANYAMPLHLAIGDTVDFLSAGAYTASYASVEFNGFAPLATHCVETDATTA